MKAKNWNDPIVEEVRAARAEIFREAGGTLNKLAEHLMASQRRHGKRLIKAPIHGLNSNVAVRPMVAAEKKEEYGTKKRERTS